MPILANNGNIHLTKANKRKYPYIDQYGLFSAETDKAVANIIESSRFAFMQGEDVRLFGDFETFQDCYFSNLRFRYYLFY